MKARFIVLLVLLLTFVVVPLTFGVGSPTQATGNQTTDIGPLASLTAPDLADRSVVSLASPSANTLAQVEQAIEHVILGPPAISAPLTSSLAITYENVFTGIIATHTIVGMQTQRGRDYDQFNPSRVQEGSQLAENVGSTFWPLSTRPPIGDVSFSAHGLRHPLRA